MKRMFIWIPILSLIFSLVGCTKVEEKEILPHHFASKEEAVELYLSNDEYFDGLSLYDLQYKNQNKEGTVEMLKEFGKGQMMDFTKIEKDAIEKGLQDIIQTIKENGYTLPSLDPIVFVKSTQEEENGSGAYTHGTTIYLGDSVISLLLANEEEYYTEGVYILAHEIFHCLTRCNPEFRKDMYSIIHFTVQDNEYEIPNCIKDMYISNPDVEHHNAYASFTIDNENVDCFVVMIATEPFEKVGDSFFTCMEPVMAPVDGTDIYYTMDDASNFWDIFGMNTDYVIDPEECMADNFGFTLAYGMNVEYISPEIITSIMDYLKK